MITFNCPSTATLDLLSDVKGFLLVIVPFSAHRQRNYGNHNMYVLPKFTDGDFKNIVEIISHRKGGEVQYICWSYHINFWPYK